MNTRSVSRWLGGLGMAVVVSWSSLVSAQTFSSGSTGALGAFAPAANTTVTLPPDGILNYTTVTVPAGVTVTFTKNAANTPVTMLATGDVSIAGIVSLNGGDGAFPGASPTFSPGGSGGPGGFDGGNGGLSTGVSGSPSSGSAGKGPGGGAPAPPSFTANGGGGSYGPSSAFVSLLPLFGGSGGGGGLGESGSGLPGAGGSGGGGGGTIVMASSTKITVSGTVTARGGAANNTSFTGFGGGSGSGGAIRLVAPQVVGAGTLLATGGDAISSGAGTPGQIRVEAFTLNFTGTRNPSGTLSTSPGPVTTASTPAVSNLPTLTISSVGGLAPPATPSGSYTTADVSLAAGTTNPVPVTLTATNTPVGTLFTVVLIPQFNAPSTATAASTGTFATSTATVNLTVPSGVVSVLNAFGSFTLPILTSALFPLIDGEPVEQILVAVAYGQPSTLSLVTRSGQPVPMSQLSPQDQLTVARAFAAMRNG